MSTTALQKVWQMILGYDLTAANKRWLAEHLYEEAKKEEARSVWGEEDENQKKALDLCEAAIKVVKQKISETENSKNALENISNDAYALQADIGSKLDESRQQVESLLK